MTQKELIKLAEKAGFSFFEDAFGNKVYADELSKFAELVADAARKEETNKTGWQAIETAPKDNKRPLYLAEFDVAGHLTIVDTYGHFDEIDETWEGNAFSDFSPTHWAYQDEPIPQVPSGWKLVPVRPTEEMIYEGRQVDCVTSSDEEIDIPEDYIRVYKAMLSAAPQPPNDQT